MRVGGGAAVKLFRGVGLHPIPTPTQGSKIIDHHRDKIHKNTTKNSHFASFFAIKGKSRCVFTFFMRLKFQMVEEFSDYRGRALLVPHPDLHMKLP